MLNECEGWGGLHNSISRLSCKESTCNVEDAGSISGSGRSPGGGNGNPLQYSCLGNPMDRGARWAIVPGVTHGVARVGHDLLTK